MNIHTITAYLKYKRKAQNRHGVHSPFAYAFVEDVIEDKKHITPLDIKIPWIRQSALRYDILVKRMMAYYGYKTIINLSTKEDKAKTTYDVLLLDSDKPYDWLQMIKDNKAFIGNDSAVVLAGIHQTAVHSEAWEKLCAAPFVKMSIDLYGIGLLFFKEGFMVKQHFVFKGP